MSANLKGSRFDPALLIQPGERQPGPPSGSEAHKLRALVADLRISPNRFASGLHLWSGEWRRHLQANQLVDLRANKSQNFTQAVWADWCHLQLNRGAISNSFGRGVDQSRVQRYNCAYEPRIGRSRPGSD